MAWADEHPISVQVHAWHYVGEGAQEHCDPSEFTPDGWCIYIRKETPNDPQQPFDITREEDRDTRDEVMAIAEQWSAEFDGAIIEEY